jgi:hypothetical protein
VTAEGIAASNAAAVKTAGPPGVPHADFQGSLSPEHLAVMQQRGQGTAANAAADAGVNGPSQVQPLQMLDFASGADTGYLARLGPRRPSGMPGQPVSHVAPTGVGAQFRQNTPRPGYVPVTNTKW